MSIFDELEYFDADEFDYPDQMDRDFLLWLEEVRHLAQIPFIITSDYRPPEENIRVGGSPNSLHLKGLAVDFVTPNARARNKQGWREDLAAIVESIVDTNASSWVPAYRSWQLELVQGPNDWHVHLGLRPEDDPLPSSISLAID